MKPRKKRTIKRYNSRRAMCKDCTAFFLENLYLEKGFKDCAQCVESQRVYDLNRSREYRVQNKFEYRKRIRDSRAAMSPEAKERMRQKNREYHRKAREKDPVIFNAKNLRRAYFKRYKDKWKEAIMAEWILTYTKEFPGETSSSYLNKTKKWREYWRKRKGYIFNKNKSFLETAERALQLDDPQDRSDWAPKRKSL